MNILKDAIFHDFLTAIYLDLIMTTNVLQLMRIPPAFCLFILYHMQNGLCASLLFELSLIINIPLRYGLAKCFPVICTRAELPAHDQDVGQPSSPFQVMVPESKFLKPYVDF